MGAVIREAYSLLFFSSQGLIVTQALINLINFINLSFSLSFFLCPPLSPSVAAVNSRTRSSRRGYQIAV